MTARVAQVGWTLHYLRDLDADFRRFYRERWRDLSGPEFFALAHRVSAYGGVMAGRIAEAEARRPESPEVTDLADLAALADCVEVG